jgi:hypothetical protein
LETVTKRPVTLVDDVQVAADAFKTDTLSLLVNQTSVTPAATNEKVELKHNGLGGLDVARVLTTEVDAVTVAGAGVTIGAGAAGATAAAAMGAGGTGAGTRSGVSTSASADVAAAPGKTTGASVVRVAAGE